MRKHEDLNSSSFSPFTAGLLSGNGQNSLNKPQPQVLETQLNTLDHAAGKTAPMRFGKRAPMRFGKRGFDEDEMSILRFARAPMRFGKRSEDVKRAPMRFGKRAPMRFGKRGDSEFLNDYNEYGYEDY